MATINEYINDLRDLLHDANSNFWTQSQLAAYVNRGRHQVAQKGQCVRFLTPSSAVLASCMVTSGGSGYTTAVATLSPPDGTTLNPVQATASVTLAGGQVTAVNVLNPGAGYVATPTIAITGDGAGAAATAVLAAHLTTVVAAHTMTFATIGALMRSLQPGLGELLGVQGVSVSRGALMPSLQYWYWSDMQAFLRSMRPGISSWPEAFSMYGDGEANGKLSFWPPAAIVSAMEVDGYYDVADISIAQTIDLIPWAWKEAVIAYAAKLAYQNAQRAADAGASLAEHTNFMMQARMVATPSRVPDPYASA